MFYLHQKKPLEQCNVCNKSFRNLVNHVRSHEKRDGAKEICKICNKSFISLNGHMKKHLNSYKKLTVKSGSTITRAEEGKETEETGKESEDLVTEEAEVEDENSKD